MSHSLLTAPELTRFVHSLLIILVMVFFSCLVSSLFISVGSELIAVGEKSYSTPHIIAGYHAVLDLRTVLQRSAILNGFKDHPLPQIVDHITQTTNIHAVDNDQQILQTFIVAEGHHFQ